MSKARRICDLTPEGLSAICRRNMGNYDSLPPELRLRISESLFGISKRMESQLTAMLKAGYTVSNAIACFDKWERVVSDEFRKKGIVP